jgi:tetratricopeptide (TPR) repeat protein
MQTLSQIQNAGRFFEEKLPLQDQLGRVFEDALQRFSRVMQRHAAFNLFFFLLCLAEVALFAVFLAFLARSLILAASLSLLFFSFFAYFTLRVYLQTKKLEQFHAIGEDYLENCRTLLHYQESVPESHIALANACCKLANRLHAKEYDFYRPPALFNFLAPWMEKFSCWLHWEEVHFLKEMMLEAAVDEQIRHVKSQPTSLEAHAALANAYVMLSGLYIDPRKLDGYDEESAIPSKKYDEKFEEKFRKTAEKAIEEFKILSHYAPNDPWIHSQLAYSYRDLQMPLEEIQQYETIQKLNPDDKDNLYKLGVLYFQQGLNAKGLKVYEELKKAHYKKAEHLIRHYGNLKEAL